MTIEEIELKIKEKTLENLIEVVSKLQSDKIVSEASFNKLQKVDITKLENADKAKITEEIITYIKSKIKEFI